MDFCLSFKFFKLSALYWLLYCLWCAAFAYISAKPNISQLPHVDSFLMNLGGKCWILGIPPTIPKYNTFVHQCHFTYSTRTIRILSAPCSPISIGSFRLSVHQFSDLWTEGQLTWVGRVWGCPNFLTFQKDISGPGQCPSWLDNFLNSISRWAPIILYLSSGRSPALESPSLPHHH